MYEERSSAKVAEKDIGLESCRRQKQVEPREHGVEESAMINAVRRALRSVLLLEEQTQDPASLSQTSWYKNRMMRVLLLRVEKY